MFIGWLKMYRGVRQGRQWKKESSGWTEQEAWDGLERIKRSGAAVMVVLTEKEGNPTKVLGRIA